MSATQQERDQTYLQHMLSCAESIQTYTKGGKAKFLANRMAQDATMRHLEVLGEAARRLSDQFRQDNPQMPWRSMMTMRNVLIHGYDSVDLAKVWDAVSITVNHTLPMLRQWLRT